MSRLAVLAHYDPLGRVGPHVRRQVEALSQAVDELVVVSTAALGEEERAWLSARGRLIARENFGYDFYSYKTGIEASPSIGDHDEVIVCNDTYVGPLRPYASIAEDMADQPADFWGFTASQRISPHLQSFFLVFRPWVVRSGAFGRFWRDMTPVNDRAQVIRSYEVGLTAALAEAGFTWASYFHESKRDARLARRRVAWWAFHRLSTPRTRKQARFMLKAARAPWNPAIGLADVALDGARLPFVKLDTLRYDPYGLGSDRLLSLCEQRYPAEFEGVRDYLAATEPHYPVRLRERLRPTPAYLKPARRLVEYGCAV